MAKVKIEELVDYLSTDFRKALIDTIEEHFPNQQFDNHEIFRTFKKMVRRKFGTWESVPDHYIEKTSGSA